MKKEELIQEINSAFKHVTLENGIGLWEGQGLDDYANEKTLQELREKDERKQWNKVPYQDLVHCQSSLSFFDDKGMRFLLPSFLVFDLLGEQVYKEQGLSSPDVLFTLGYKLNSEYQKKRFSLFDTQQIQCIIHFLEYKMEAITNHYASTPEAIYADDEYLELTLILQQWKQKYIDTL